MPTTNQTLSTMFAQMGDVLEILGENMFKVNAFRKISRVLDELPQDVEQIGPDAKALAKLEGVGKGSAERIAEYLDTGKMTDYDELIVQVPAGLFELFDISGLGPKTIALMWHEAGIESKADLIAKLDSEELAALPRLGKKKLESIRKSIEFAEAAGQRVKIGTAMPVALAFIEQLKAMKEVKQCEYAGSLRRGKETIGDVDLLVTADKKHAQKIADAFVQFDTVTDVLVKGETKTSVRTKDNLQIDLRYVDPDSFGAAWLYFTGSKEHNIKLRERCLKQGMTLNEYALKKVDDDEVVASKTEADIYEAVGLDWIPPEMREARNEIELAEKGKLPKLLELSDIKAELHAHTTASDGRWSIEGLATAAAERGFHTIAVTDHSKGQVQARGLDEKRLEKHIKEIHKVADQMKGDIRILAGSEVDILTDGQLDYADSLLEQLDIVVASPHAALTQDPKKATARLLKAIENPFVTIIGHPTGRLVGRREGLSPDIKVLIKAAKDRGIALEINANSWRLDLRDSHARLAIEADVKLAINTDAHGPGDLDELQYGVLTARRAGATKKDVVNCMSKSALEKWLKGTRG